MFCEHPGQASSELPDTTTDPRWHRVDGPALLAVASALQLNPANVAWLLRLQRLAVVAAGLPSRPDAPTLTFSKLKGLLAAPGIDDADTPQMQDPYEGLFTYEVLFYGGPRLTVQGLATHSGHSADFLLRSIFRAPEGAFPAAFLAKVKALAELLLTVSDNICRNAGLNRLSIAKDDRKHIDIPSKNELKEMPHRVQLNKDKVLSTFSDSMRKYLWVKLVRDQGQSVSPPGDCAEWPTIQPLVCSGTRIVAPAPPELTAALRHHVICAAIEEKCVETLIDSMLSLSVDRMKELLGGMVDNPLELVVREKNWARLQAQFDRDKLMDVFIIVDDLDGYNHSAAYETWDAKEVLAKVEQEASKTPHSDRILRIYSPVTVGRHLTSDLEGDSPTLFASWEELQTILQTRGFDGLGLWYFARAERRFRQRTSGLTFSTVDTFADYRDHGMSFDLGNEPLPSFYCIEPGSGQQLRVENAQNYDRRYFVMPGKEYYAEAWSVHGRNSSPIYLTRTPYGIAYVVDLDTTIVWVYLSQNEKKADASFDRSLMVVAEALAYWIWQLWKEEPDTIAQSATVEGIIECVVRFSPFKSDSNQRLRAERRGSALDFEFSTDKALPRQGNEIDRVLVAELYRLLGGIDDGIVDRVAPAGLKGMIHVTDYRDMSAWAHDREPAWPGAKEAGSELLDELGSHLTGELRLPIGPVPDCRRIQVLTDYVVPWLIDRLRDEIADLSGVGLLERLIERNEALIAHWASEAALLAPRIACFGAADDEVEHIHRRQSTADTSLMTSRFLIEFASAFPPSGANLVNRERYERLMALGSEIISKGMLADSLKDAISDTHLCILQSGRLGWSGDDDSYMNALKMFSHFRAESVLADATQNTIDRRVRRPDLIQADELAAETFGFTYTELLEGAHALVDLLEDRQTVTTSQDVLHDTLTDALNWDEEKIHALLRNLTLSPFPGTMKKFWKDRNVFPWRFNRDRSYLKCPLIQHKGEFSFGRRALLHAPVYWIEQYRTGRLRATGKMASAINHQRNAKGRDFETRIASLLRDIGYKSVKERLHRIRKYDFRKLDGRDLGDIDVFALDVKNRKIVLIEAKDLEIARTPTELRNEVKQLIGPGNSAIERLKEREDWIRSHMNTVLTEFKIHNRNGWSTQAIVVVSHPILSEYLRHDANIPVIPIEKLESHLSTTK